MSKDEEQARLQWELEAQRLSAIGQISAGIAHEIRNPLTTVKGFLQLMQKEHDSRYWEVVNAALEQAIATVHNLLAVSRPELDEEPRTRLSLSSLTEQTLSLFDSQRHRVKIVRRIRQPDAMIEAKRNQLKRAIFNLLQNAFEAMDEGGTLTIEHHQTGRYVCLRIADTGRGIPADKLPLLGTPFFSTKSAVGTGLGLSQVYAAMHEHQALIQVKSEVGKGTAFTIRFPLPDRNTEDRMQADFRIDESMDLKAFFMANQQQFNRQLEQEAKTSFEAVAGLPFVTAQDLLDHANQILGQVLGGATQEIIRLAQKRGLAWAKSDVPIMTKMEWFYALRKVIWTFLRRYYVQAGIAAEDVFALSERVHDALDQFIIQFNVVFTQYREEVLRAKQALIDELTVPVIPITDRLAVLPIIGALDEARLRKIEDKLLDEIERKGIRKIFLDLSGAELAESAATPLVLRMVEGVRLLGCQAVVTGIGARLARAILDAGEPFAHRLAIESTLQQALLQESFQ